MARNALHLGLGQVATTALTMFLSAAVGRTLGAADFGLLYFLTSVANFAYVFVDWGHCPYITREVALRPERSGELMGAVLTVRAATALIVCVIGVAATWLMGYDGPTQVLVATMIAAQLPTYLGLSYGWVFRGHERMDRDALINVVLKFTTLVLSLVVLAAGGRLRLLILVPAVSGTVTLALAAHFYRRLGLPSLRVTAATMRELMYGGVPLLAVGLAVAVQPYLDANILYKFAPPDVVGWYGAAWNIAGTLVAPATIMAATMYPRLSRASSDPVEFKRALRSVFRPLLLVAVLGGVGTYLFADLAVGIIYSTKKFGPSGNILRAFAPALMLFYVDLLLGHAILAAGKAGRFAGAKVAAIVVTTSLELALVPWFQSHFANGGIGVMVSLAGGELLMVTAALVLIREALDRRMFVDVLRGLLGGVTTVWLMQWLPPVTPFVGIPVCVLGFLGLSVAVGLVNRDDFELLTAVFRKDPAQAKPLGG